MKEILEKLYIEYQNEPNDKARTAYYDKVSLLKKQGVIAHEELIEFGMKTFVNLPDEYFWDCFDSTKCSW